MFPKYFYKVRYTIKYEKQTSEQVASPFTVFLGQQRISRACAT